jgi:hypothetical protein
MFGRKKEEVTGCSRKLRHKEHFNLYSLPNIITIIKISQEMSAERKPFEALVLLFSPDFNS